MKNLFVLLILFFLQGVFTNIHHPLMPAYVAQLNLPNFMFGFFFAFMNLGMLVGAPLWGSLADSGKKRLSVVLGFMMYGIFQLLFGFGNYFSGWFLSLIRFFSGLGIAASYTVITSEIIIVSKPNQKIKNIAFGAMMLALGAALGQYLGGLLYTADFFIKLLNTDNIFNVLLIQFIASLVLTLYTFVFYKPVKLNNKSIEKKPSFFQNFKAVKTINSSLLVFLIALTFITIAQTNIDKFLDVYFINILNYKENVLGQFKMLVGFVSIFASLFIVPLLAKFKNKISLLCLLQILSAVIIYLVFNNILFSFMTSLYSIYFIYIILKTTTEPLEREYISSHAKHQNLSTIMGIRHSFYSLGTIIGPIVGAFIFDYNPKILFTSSAVIFLFATFLISLIKTPLKESILQSNPLQV